MRYTVIVLVPFNSWFKTLQTKSKYELGFRVIKLSRGSAEDIVWSQYIVRDIFHLIFVIIYSTNLSQSFAKMYIFNVQAFFV